MATFEPTGDVRDGDATGEIKGEQMPAHLTLLPMFLEAGFEVQAMVGGPTPWGAPFLLGSRGVNPQGEPELIIAGELPLPWVRSREGFEKRELEDFHLQRFAVDARLATGQEFFETFEPGGDPPDYVLWCSGTSRGCELTTLSIESRRQAQALFGQVRRRLFRHRRDIGHLSGYNIHIWFGCVAGTIGSVGATTWSTPIPHVPPWQSTSGSSGSGTVGRRRTWRLRSRASNEVLPRLRHAGSRLREGLPS